MDDDWGYPHDYGNPPFFSVMVQPWYREAIGRGWNLEAQLLQGAILDESNGLDVSAFVHVLQWCLDLYDIYIYILYYIYIYMYTFQYIDIAILIYQYIDILILIH